MKNVTFSFLSCIVRGASQRIRETNNSGRIHVNRNIREDTSKLVIQNDYNAHKIENEKEGQKEEQKRIKE